MEKKRPYERKYKYISIKLFKEEGYILSDIIFIQYNVNIDNLNIYDTICFQRKRSIFSKICKHFSKPKRPHKRAEIVENRMRKLIEKEPTISAQEIKYITGYNWPVIIRYYMKLKIELNDLRENKNR